MIIWQTKNGWSDFDPHDRRDCFMFIIQTDKRRERVPNVWWFRGDWLTDTSEQNKILEV